MNKKDKEILAQLESLKKRQYFSNNVQVGVSVDSFECKFMLKDIDRIIKLFKAYVNEVPNKYVYRSVWMHRKGNVLKKIPLEKYLSSNYHE